MTPTSCRVAQSKRLKRSETINRPGFQDTLQRQLTETVAQLRHDCVTIQPRVASRPGEIGASDPCATSRRRDPVHCQMASRIRAGERAVCPGGSTAARWYRARCTHAPVCARRQPWQARLVAQDGGDARNRLARCDHVRGVRNAWQADRARPRPQSTPLHGGSGLRSETAWLLPVTVLALGRSAAAASRVALRLDSSVGLAWM